MSNDALILDLAANLEPVRRRSILREALLLLAVAGAEAGLVLGLGIMRHDMGQMVGAGTMAWKVGSLAILAIVTCTVAIRSFSPPASPRLGLKLTLGLIAATVIGGLLMGSATDTGRSFLERLSPSQGVLCTASIVVLALPLMATLGAAMRRAAPTHPEISALAAGVAAGTCGALVFTLCCPMDDPLYVVVWYCAGCAIIAALSRWLLPRRFRL